MNKQLGKNLSLKQKMYILNHNVRISEGLKPEPEDIICNYCKDAVATNWVHSVEVCSDCFSEVYE